MSRLRWALGIGFVGLIINGMVPASKTQIAANAQSPSPAETAEAAKREAAFQRTVLIARALKDGLRDPDSLTWESIRSNDDASLICIRYRARNGFGGMNREFVVVHHNNASQKIADWNRYCTSHLIDMNHATEAI